MMKLYVLVDPSLSKSQKAVQTAHAVAQYLIDNPNTDWDNGTLVVLKARDIDREAAYADSIFREPDLENKITAITKLGNNLYPDYVLL